jgi:hypothetical protein
MVAREKDIVAEDRAPRRAVYKVLLGGYESFNDDDQIVDEGLEFICLTDNPDLKSKKWKFELVEPVFPQDPIRSQRFLKINGHPALDGFDQLIYCDNSVTITGPLSAVFDEWLADADVCFPEHSFHATVLDEFDAVLRLERDAHDRVSEQLFHYYAQDPETLHTTPLWTGFFARRHERAIQDFSRFWFLHIARYSRRDQLSLPFVLAAHSKPLRVKTVPLDNHQSNFHRWQWTEVQEKRPKELSHSNHEGTLPLLAEVTRLQNKLAREREKSGLLSNQVSELELGLQQLNSHIEAVYATLSWRVTAPLRRFRKQ